MDWLIENIGTILVCAGLVLIVAAIIRSMIRNKKKGISSCGCGCSTCAMGELCGSKKEDK